MQIILFNNSLKPLVSKDTIKNTLDFRLTTIDGNLPKLNDKKLYNFSLKEIETKRKAQMNEPIETVIIRGQQKFDLHSMLNLIQIEINDDRILNIPKENIRKKQNKYKNVYDKLTPVSILFLSSIINNTKQLFVTWRELNNTKTALINDKIYGIINLNIINSWDYIKGKSLWVNVNFDEPKQTDNREHLSFSFKTLSLNDLLHFSINLIDGNKKPLGFNSGETKISILHFKIEVLLKWIAN